MIAGNNHLYGGQSYLTQTVMSIHGENMGRKWSI